jgi:predicted lipase
MTPLDLLALCEHTYFSATVSASCYGRDGASIVNEKGTTVLVFRGTVVYQPDDNQDQEQTAWLDWLHALHYDLVAQPGFPGRIHAGFGRSLDALWKYLDRWDWTTGGDLLITGHSKGGALAQLAGWWLRHLQPKIVTFGAPRVGDATFAATWDRRNLDCTNYANTYDVIPCLPLGEYVAVGHTVKPPATWLPPYGLHANHLLPTGYAPWITQANLRPVR